ncbi:sugar translocase [Peribacillus simplex]|uniref:Sugar translocase n=2 Tax=Peribacillus TaxID=2675229 RepID=A0AA90P7B8_9BACI|nr:MULTISPECIES: oligosaccharide flippase family protein [Peribacillus]MDP1417454.1 sugar translocase [Peribacillus simplex]MDP1450109.1 sugar translocase [Peribacillus frigoritolerans]
MRIRSSIINISFAMVGQILGLLISFIARIVFIQELGTEYLGLNGLFVNILSILSLVELGIGPAITFSLYKPLAENDTEKVKSLMKLYKKAYICIGILILIMGISFTPFIEVFIKTLPNIPHIHLIFLLFVINAAISYFYSYKRSLIISNQKQYIATIYRYSFFILLNIIQIIVLYLTHNFILFLVCQIIATFAENIVVSKKADKLYPYLQEKNVQKVDKLTISQITRNIRALTSHKLGGVVVTSTDSLIISKFVGLVGVGLYSNYQLIINALNIVTSQIFSSITASVGNLGVTETDEKKISIFNIVFFMNFWIYSFISICLVVLLNPFIKLWIGEDFVINTSIVLVIILNFFLTGMRKGVLTFRDALGIYWYDRHKPIFECIINLVVSLILVKQLGMLGVFIGTTISTLATSFWVEPYVLYKYGFKSSVVPFFRKYALYTIVTIIVCLITLYGVNNFRDVTIVNFIIQAFICIVIPNGIFVILFHKTDEFRYLYNLINKLIFKLLKRKNVL